VHGSQNQKPYKEAAWRCEYVFEHTGNRCQLPLDHFGSHRWNKEAEQPTEMLSLRKINEKLDLLLAIKDDTVRFRELLLGKLETLTVGLQNHRQAYLQHELALVKRIENADGRTIYKMEAIAANQVKLLAAIDAIGANGVEVVQRREAQYKELLAGINELLDREAKATAALPGILKARAEQVEAINQRLAAIFTRLCAQQEARRGKAVKRKQHG
jgi:hypothetical protein